MKAHFAVVAYVFDHRGDGRPLMNIERNLGRIQPAVRKCPVCGTSVDPTISIK